jgi:hypothetical protein
MAAEVFESMRHSALAATKRKDDMFLRAVFNQHKDAFPGLSCPQKFRDALAAVAAPRVPADSLEASQRFARLAISNHSYLTFEEFKRAVEEPDSLEAWLDEEPTFKLGCLAPALRTAIQASKASMPLPPASVADAALRPLLALSLLDESAAILAVEASLEAIQKQLCSKLLSLRRIFQSKSQAQARRSEFVCGQMQVGTVQDFYVGLQGRVGMCMLCFSLPQPRFSPLFRAFLKLFDRLPRPLVF